ncbi:WD40 repeat-like protein [Xylariaceae sp. FL0255]|nr:WD40 repeat-like protein [Xylariaceae sp. FL0255]
MSSQVADTTRLQRSHDTSSPPPPSDDPRPSIASASAENGTNIPYRSASNVRGAKFLAKDPPRDSREWKSSARTASPSQPAIAVDPISHHIFARTLTDRSIASRLLNSTRPESPANEPLPRPSSDLSNKLSTAQPDPPKDKKKGVSFLSRLSMIGGKKRDDGSLDDDSELGEQRPEGANALAFSSAAFIPHHKEPPRYIRLHAHHKKVKEFDHTFLAQELLQSRAGGEQKGPIWATEFSHDGRMLATGGRDRVVRVWAVIATEEERKAYEESDGDQIGEHLSAPVFHPMPIREFTGHEGDVLDLSWSKNNFLLSSSMDKTVRLWHMSRQECLCTFKHKDFVASIAFHPRDDRFFLAGSLDSILRLWSIPDKAVAFSSNLSELITAVGFSPSGKTAIAGCFSGMCMFFDTEGLNYQTQLHVRSSRGKNAKGSKITGIKTIIYPPENPNGEVKLLITSNDSRIRIYNLADKTLEMKLKSHENISNQIRANFSDDGSYVICGSEDRRAYIWSKGSADLEGKDKSPCEYFEAHSETVTTAIFAPTKTRQLLQASGDPIFSLCNPPPVMLLSREESTTNLTVTDTQSEHSAKARKPGESPAFVARSTHYDGNIIVTTDQSGTIKIFRQDCAYTKRRHENWETNSLSRRLGRDGLLGRTGSIMTRTSASSRDPHSRRGSLSQAFQVNSDRINSWRQDVEGAPGRPLSIATTTTPARSERSISPTKATRTSRTTPASEARKLPYSAVTPTLQSPSGSVRSIHTNERSRGELSVPPTPSFSFHSAENDANDLRLDAAGASYSFWNLNKWRNLSSPKHERTISDTLTPGMVVAARDRDRDRRKSSGPEMLIIDKDKDKDKSKENNRREDRRRTLPAPSRLRPSPLEEREESNDCGNLLVPPERERTRTESVMSRLSSELTASEDGEETRCVKCGSRDFRAKKVLGQQRLLCRKCGRMVDQ